MSNSMRREGIWRRKERKREQYDVIYSKVQKSLILTEVHFLKAYLWPFLEGFFRKFSSR